MTKMKPQPNDHHNRVKIQDPEKNACDDQKRRRVETWLDGVEEFVTRRSTSPKDYRSWLRAKGRPHFF